VILVTWPRSRPASPISAYRLSQDSNMFRKLVTDGERIHGVEFVLVNALSCDTESHKAESMTAESSHTPVLRC